MGVLKANIGGVWTPIGADGAPGPAGPTAVSVDAGNAAVLGTDGLLYVPDTAKLPRGLVGFAQATASSWTNATATETDLTVTAGQPPSLSLALDPTRRYRARLNARFSTATPGGTVQVRLNEGGVARLACLGRVEGGAAPINVWYEYLFVPASAALTIYKMMGAMMTASGSVTLTASGGSPMQFYIEDLGGV